MIAPDHDALNLCHSDAFQELKYHSVGICGRRGCLKNIAGHEHDVDSLAFDVSR
jgi:hypothetical protein